VCAGVEEPSWLWISMEMNIFSYGTYHVQLKILSNQSRRRYWEDSLADQVLPKVQGELDNAPGLGRIERLTHDDYRYGSIVLSQTNKYVCLRSFSSYLIESRGTVLWPLRRTRRTTRIP
jgi:hypothetical protein